MCRLLHCDLSNCPGDIELYRRKAWKVTGDMPLATGQWILVFTGMGKERKAGVGPRLRFAPT